MGGGGGKKTTTTHRHRSASISHSLSNLSWDRPLLFGSEVDMSADTIAASARGVSVSNIVF